MNMNKERMSVILGKIPNKVDMGLGSKEEQDTQNKYDEKEALAQDVLTAIESKDAKGLAQAIEALMSCCSDEEEVDEEM